MAVLVFAGVLIIIILPVKAFTYYKVIDAVKGKVLGASESAFIILRPARCIVRMTAAMYGGFSRCLRPDRQKVL